MVLSIGRVAGPRVGRGLGPLVAMIVTSVDGIEVEGIEVEEIEVEGIEMEEMKFKRQKWKRQK